MRDFWCDAVLLDMDGTLVDSTAAVVRQWKRWAERHGLDAAAILASAHGRRTIETIREFAPRLATPEHVREFEVAEVLDREGIVAVAGAAGFVANLPPGRWAVVTSASQELARVRLECAGLPLPAVLVSSDDVDRGKPDPEGYLSAARRLGLPPSRCVVIEDAPPGVAAGLAAGMPVIALTTSHPPGDLAGAVCVPDFRALSLVRRDGALRISIDAA